uniref:TNF superfamily member 13b n=1 Tax=Oncorhynchus tshawytscha TaxID=74940 RepID=A0A8C8BQV4_ONCTS
MVSAGPSPEAVGPVPGQESGGRRLSWPVLLLTLAAVTSSSLSALSLFHLLALRAEVVGLRAEVFRRREEVRCLHIHCYSVMLCSVKYSSPHHPESQTRLPFIRERSVSTGPENTAKTSNTILWDCLYLFHMLKGDRARCQFCSVFRLYSGPHTGIPWQEVLRRGSPLEAESDSILVREEGYYFVYSQVSTGRLHERTWIFAMGHVVNRKKRNVVGDEDMNPVYPNNTCYTGGIVKLEVGDMVELLIPRSTANISLDGDSSFLGAFRLV